MDLSENYYANIAADPSFDTDNDSILSMTSSINDDEEKKELSLEPQRDNGHDLDGKEKEQQETEQITEPALETDTDGAESIEDVLVQNDPDADDFIPESLSDFIANADKMYSDLVADLDLPSSPSSEDNKLENSQDVNMETVNEVIQTSKTEKMINTKKISKNTKIDIFSPISDIASPQDPNTAEKYNTVPVAKRKVFSPERSLENPTDSSNLSKSHNNLGNDFALEKKESISQKNSIKTSKADIEDVEIVSKKVESNIIKANARTSIKINKNKKAKNDGSNLAVIDTSTEENRDEQHVNGDTILLEPTDSASVNESMEANFLPTGASSLNDAIEDNFLPNSNHSSGNGNLVDDSLLLGINDNNISLDTESSSSDDDLFFPNRNSIFKPAPTPKVNSTSEPKKQAKTDSKNTKLPSSKARRSSAPIAPNSRLLKSKSEPTLTSKPARKSDVSTSSVSSVSSSVRSSTKSISTRSKKLYNSSKPIRPNNVSTKSSSNSSSTTSTRKSSSPSTTSTRKSRSPSTTSIRKSSPPKASNRKPAVSTHSRIKATTTHDSLGRRRTKSRDGSKRASSTALARPPTRKQPAPSPINVKQRQEAFAMKLAGKSSPVKSPRDKAMEIVKSKLSEKRRSPSNKKIKNNNSAKTVLVSPSKERHVTQPKTRKHVISSKLSLDMDRIKNEKECSKETEVPKEKILEEDEKCDTVTTAENTVSSVASTEEADVDNKTLTDASENSDLEQKQREITTPTRKKNKAQKSTSPSPRKDVNKSMQKHFERLKAAREKRLSTKSAFRTPVQLSSKLKDKLTNARKTTSSTKTTPKEPNLLSSKRPRSRDRSTIRKMSLAGDPMHENPITTNWGASTHGNFQIETPSKINMNELTTPMGPTLSTSKRNGEKNYSTSSIVSCSDTATLGSVGTKQSYTPSLTEFAPFNLSSSQSEPKPRPTNKPTFGEFMNFVEQKGFREIPSEDSKWKPGVTVPNPPKLSTPKPKDIKGQDQIDNEIMEEARKNPFKARPVPMHSMESKGEQGLPKPPRVKPTTPKPFRLHTSIRHGGVTPSTPTSEDLKAKECEKQFHARPMPDLSYRPPKVPAVQKKVPTTPKPFHLHTESREAHFRHKTPTSEARNAAECARQFHARPMPDLSYRPCTTPRLEQKSPTKPEPFSFVSKGRKKAKSPQEISEDDIELSKQFSARPIPDLTYRPPKQASSQVKKLTRPAPFHLHTDLRGTSKSPARRAYEEEEDEASYQFQAKPMPDLRYKPPKALKQERTPTTPKPFSFHSRPSTPKSRKTQASDDDIEMAKQFHAKPLPESTKKISGSVARRSVLEKLKRMRSRRHRETETNGCASSVGSNALTVPEPFHLHTEIRREVHEANLQQRLKNEEELEHRARQYKAAPAPNFKKRVFTPKRSGKDLTTPEPFHLESNSRREVSLSLLEEKKIRQDKELRQLSFFKAKPAPKAKAPFTPRLSGSKKSPLSIGPNFETEVRARSREAFDKEQEQRKKNDTAKKRLIQRKKELEEKRELMALRRKSVLEGGLCFKAKPINSIFKERTRKARVTPI